MSTRVFFLQAKAVLAEYQPRHSAAKAVLRERKSLTDDLARPALPVPPKGTAREAQQLAAWKRLLAFERWATMPMSFWIFLVPGLTPQ